MGVKQKTTKNTTKSKKKAKELSFKQKYMYVNSWSRQRASDTFIEMLIEKMLDHFADDKHICMYEFLADNGISWYNMTEWRKRHKELEDVYQFVRMKIGASREKRSIYKRYGTNPQSINPTLRYYHPDWRKLADEEKTEEDNKNKSYNITLPPLEELYGVKKDKD